MKVDAHCAASCVLPAGWPAGQLPSFAIAIGVAGVVAGGIDDSPGLQLLSLLLVTGAVVLGVRMVLRSR
jgi:hypothetical protein